MTPCPRILKLISNFEIFATYTLKINSNAKEKEEQCRELKKVRFAMNRIVHFKEHHNKNIVWPQNVESGKRPCVVKYYYSDGQNNGVPKLNETKKSTVVRNNLGS